MASIHWIKNAVRARDILGTLVRHGFWDFVDKVDGDRYWLGRLAPMPAPEQRSVWVRLRLVLEDLGPTFVKLGQLASTREDSLPAELVAELRKLRDAVRPSPWAEVEPVLLAALPGRVTTHFRKFDTEPVACGSLGQVYRAELYDGTTVAVKIRRPNITESVRADMEILRWLVNAAHSRIPELRAYDLPSVIDEASDGLMRELDFRIEARNAEEFTLLNEEPLVFAPKVFGALSSESVHVAEWIDGVPVTRIQAGQDERRELARATGDAFFNLILSTGFFHGDPHPGNVRLTHDGRLALLDWGAAGQLTLRMRRFLADLFAAVDSQDAERVVRVALSDPSALLSHADAGRMEAEVSRVLRRHSGFSVETGGVGRLMVDLLRVFGTHGIRLSRDYSVLARSVLLMESTCRTMDPEFDIATRARELVKRLVRERYNPLKWGRGVAESLATSATSLAEVPAQISRLLRRIESGAAGVVIEHRGLDAFNETIDRVVNRVVFAIIVAALLVGSSLLVPRAGTGSVWAFPSNLGVVGYIMAFGFTLYLIIDILRHNRHR